MSEQKVKKREWVKTAAIIFLSIMLVLTFASNTIMNHSLPEVAVQYVQPGSVSAKIRGTGTVTANESYEVKGGQTREVLSVPVKVGDKVEVGDTLLYYSDGESSQIKEVETALDALVLAYQKALINATNDGDYAAEKRAIELAQKALNKAKADRDANTYSQQELADAKTAVNKAKQEYNIQKAKVDNLTEQLGGMTPPQNNTDWSQVSLKQKELAAAQKVLQAVEIANRTEYNKLKGYADAWRNLESRPESELETYMSALSQYLENNIIDIEKPTDTMIKLPYTATPESINEKTAVPMVKAFNAVKAEKDKVAGIQRELDALLSGGSSGDWNYETVKKQLQEAKSLLSSLEAIKTRSEDALALVEEKKTKFDAADKLVDSSQTDLEAAMFTLEEKRRTDGKQGAIEALELADQKKQIEKKKEELSELKAGGTGASLESKVNGIVKSVSITAGTVAEANATLMTVEVPDMGYSISLPVTIEQSKRVNRGDAAEISYYYYGDTPTATLIDIKTDPENPTANKLLVFKIQGEVESGTQLSLTIGERGQNYETMVPNSAVRSDNNGQFVLAVIAKDSPLGNRYIAQRIDVKVLATDDANSAVSGGLSPSDFVITTSTKPIEPGMQVRLVD